MSNVYNNINKYDDVFLSLLYAIVNYIIISLTASPVVVELIKCQYLSSLTNLLFNIYH